MFKSSIVPTVGRSILCHVVIEGARQVLPGIIVRVVSEDVPGGQFLLNVKMFADPVSCGIAELNLVSVPIFDARGVSEAVPPEVQWCEWMPYQMGQAKKTEEINAAYTKPVEVQGPSSV